MAKLVTVLLDRTYSYQEKDDAPELAYGPGRVQVPLSLAERLKARKVVADWSDALPETFPVDPNAHLIGSMELAPDFPGREYLFLAGHTTYDHVLDLSKEDLEGLPGIGASKATLILEAANKARARIPQPAPSEPEPAPSEPEQEASSGTTAG